MSRAYDVVLGVILDSHCSIKIASKVFECPVSYRVPYAALAVYILQICFGRDSNGSLKDFIKKFLVILVTTVSFISNPYW